ncbi:MAG: D-hexose-6-phosphate mutarotase [Tepidisphaeraceae bacterium]
MSDTSYQAVIETLAKKFGTVSGVSFDTGMAGLPRLCIKTPLAEAHIYLYGAHVTHFQPAKQKPVLFLSSVPVKPGAAIRGGVPISFPWFAVRRKDFDAGPATKDVRHGLARTMMWDLTDIQRAGDDVVARLSLYADDYTRSYWPADFSAEYVVRVGTALHLSLIVHNLGTAPIRFEEALHTYYGVSEVGNVTLDGPRWARELKFDKPTDHIAQNTPDTVVLKDSGFQRSIAVEKTNSASTVVWFPWMPEAGKTTLGDMTQPESRQMLCIETANVGPAMVTLAPGATHTMRTRISVGK